MGYRVRKGENRGKIRLAANERKLTANPRSGRSEFLAHGSTRMDTDKKKLIQTGLLGGTGLWGDRSLEAARGLGRRRGGSLDIGPSGWARNGLHISTPLLGCLRLPSLACIPRRDFLCSLRGRQLETGLIFLAGLIHFGVRVRRVSPESRRRGCWQLHTPHRLWPRTESLDPL
jgi:hypothetical protein